MDLIWVHKGHVTEAQTPSGTYQIYYIGRGTYALILPEETKASYHGDFEACQEYAEDNYLSDYFNY